MKTLQNNYTTPEQSKRLLELGVPADSADMLWDGSIDANEGWIFEDFPIYSDKPFSYYQLLYRETDAVNILPCWSVGRLIEMWEICVGVKFDRWSRNGVLLPLIEDCIEHIEFALNPYTKVEFDFSKLEE